MAITRERRRLGWAALGLAAAWLAPAAATAQETLYVREFVLARGVVEREPVGLTDHFARADGRAFAFARIANSGEPVTLYFVWRRGDDVHHVFTTTVGASPGWRVWSSVTLAPGPWTVDLVTTTGSTLAAHAFYIE